jgi:uncharacterized protein with von Willebrand factor type A (vWA) domain
MSTEQKSSEELAREKEERSEQAQKEIEELEQADELPTEVSEWPSGPAKYETFGKDDDAYGDGATEKLGPANLKRHADGSVSIDGKKVDNPDDYKGEPIVAAVDRMDAEEAESEDEAA